MQKNLLRRVTRVHCAPGSAAVPSAAAPDALRGYLGINAAIEAQSGTILEVFGT